MSCSNVLMVTNICYFLLFCNEYEIRIGIIYINLAVRSNVTSPFAYYAYVYDTII